MGFVELMTVFAAGINREFAMVIFLAFSYMLFVLCYGAKPDKFA